MSTVGNSNIHFQQFFIFIFNIMTTLNKLYSIFEPYILYNKFRVIILIITILLKKISTAYIFNISFKKDSHLY